VSLLTIQWLRIYIEEPSSLETKYGMNEQSLMDNGASKIRVEALKWLSAQHHNEIHVVVTHMLIHCDEFELLSWIR
jgi:hypothetical protein